MKGVNLSDFQPHMLGPTAAEGMAKLLGKSQAPEPLSEKDFMAQVAREAKRLGWRVYHTHDSRKSERGFPDLCMVRGQVLVFMELKSEGGRPTADQLSWMEDLSQVEKCGVHLFYPRDWNVISEILTSGPQAEKAK